MIKLKNIRLKGGNKLLIENGEFSADCGQLTLICGQSGCGKSTLLYEIGLLTYDENIEYSIADKNVRELNNHELLNLKRYEIGYVFQSNDLFEDESVRYNISHFASLVNKVINEQEMQEYLELLQLKVSLKQRVKELSGGERQRIAILCALVKESSILVLDEITSALDTDNEERVLKILKNIAVKKNVSIVLASHSSLAKHYADKVYEIKDKKLICIKDVESHIFHKELFLNKKLNLSLKQYLDYTKSYFQRYFFLNLLLVFALTCGLAFISFLDYYQYYFQQEIDVQVDSMSYNELWVYDGKLSEEENLKIKNDILKIAPNVEVYPYFKGNCIIDDQLVEAVSFYLNDKNNKLLSYESNKDTGIFITNTFSDEKSFVVNGETINIQGRFERGVRLYNSDYEFVGISNPSLAFNVQYNGYIVRTKDFNELLEVYSLLMRNTDYIVDSSMQDIAKLEGYIYESNSSMNSYYIGAFVFISLLFSVFYILYYSSRKVELTYLKVNGYTNYQLSVFLALENMCRYLIGAVLSIFVSLIIKIYVFEMNVLIMDIISTSIILSLFFMIIPYIFSCIYIYLLKPIKVYRM